MFIQFRFLNRKQIASSLIKTKKLKQFLIKLNFYYSHRFIFLITHFTKFINTFWNMLFYPFAKLP